MTNQKIILDKPTLILGVGISGSGKSTLLKRVARAVADSVYIEKDLLDYAYLWKPEPDARDPLAAYRPARTIPRDDPQNAYFNEHLNFQTYHCMLALARQALELGKHPIVEGNFVKEIRWGYIERVVKPMMEGLDYRLKIILTHAPADIIRERIRVRGAAHDAQKIASDESWRAFLELEPPIPPELNVHPHFKIDTSVSVADGQFAELLGHLRA